MNDPYESWEPAEGDHVVIVETGRTGTVLYVTPDGRHRLCEVEYDAPAGDAGDEQATGYAGERGIHAPVELDTLDIAPPDPT